MCSSNSSVATDEFQGFPQGLDSGRLQASTATRRGRPQLLPPPLRLLLTPANSSAVYQTLNENDGKGLMFETEGDTLANTFDSDYGNYSGFKDFNLRQCLFGLYLLSPETQTVAIVEAEKTTIVASLFFPDVLFLATGGITNLRPETCKPLRGRRVILFPDLDAEEHWKEKAQKTPGLNNCIKSNWLTNIATDEMREKGFDIADVLENWNPETKLRLEDFIK